MLKIIFFAIITLASSLCPVMAQTVAWQLQPGEYESIKRVNTNLFLVEKAGKIGLISSNGTVLIPVLADKISQFHEGRALITSNDSNGNKIIGVLKDDGRCFAFANDFYTRKGQEFFSDDVIPVADADGHLGYVDEQGVKVVGFNSGYTNIKPFTEGHASVFKGDKYFLIDKEGTPAQFKVNGVCQITVGTNPYRGLAYLLDGRAKKWYSYDIDRNLELKKVKNIKETQPKVDYLYRLSSLTGKNMDVPFTESYKDGVMGFAPTEKDGLYGFYDNELEIAPCQFSEATPFEDGYSIVKINGQPGIISYVGTDKFGTLVEVPDKKFQNKDVKCEFTLYTPSVWENKDLKLTLVDDRGFFIPMNNNDGQISFNYRATSPGIHTFTLTATCENLKLFEKQLSYNFEKGAEGSPTKPKPTPSAQKICPTCGKKIKDCKYHGVH